MRLTRKQAILKLLIQARLENKPFILHMPPVPSAPVYISGGFRPMWFFRGKDEYAGGDAADVRLRELRRDHLVPIELKNHSWEIWSPSEMKTIRRSTPIYRLALTPDEIRAHDWAEAWEQPFGEWDFEEQKQRQQQAHQELAQSELFA